MIDDAKSMIWRASEGDEVVVQDILARHLPVLRAYIRLRMGPRVRQLGTESVAMIGDDAVIGVVVTATCDGFTLYAGAREARFELPLARRPSGGGDHRDNPPRRRPLRPPVVAIKPRAR